MSMSLKSTMAAVAESGAALAVQAMMGLGGATREEAGGGGEGAREGLGGMVTKDS